jgi:hypothetical protein
MVVEEAVDMVLELVVMVGLVVEEEIPDLQDPFLVEPHLNQWLIHLELQLHMEQMGAMGTIKLVLTGERVVVVVVPVVQDKILQRHFQVDQVVMVDQEFKLVLLLMEQITIIGLEVEEDILGIPDQAQGLPVMVE